MKINLIIPSFYPAVVYGGPIFSTLYTCEELSKLNNLEVYVSTTNANMDSYLDVETNKWIKIKDNFFVKYYYDTKLNKFSLPLAINIWKDIKNADIIHIQSIFSTSTIISLFYAKMFKKPIVLSPRGQFGNWCLNNGNKLKFKWLDWFIKPYANKIIWHATAKQEKNEILALFPDAKVVIIPNGIKFEEFQYNNLYTKKEYLKKFTNKDLNADKIIVSMGRLQKKKGFDILINAFEKVLQTNPNAKLLIAGGDEGEKDNLENQIKKLNLENKVFLIGLIAGQDKIDFLANADLFVLPSHNENFGNVYIESLAAGTPIVASKNTPWQDVEKYNCGKWVNNTVTDTTNAMIEMLQKDRNEMRKNAKEFAKKYDWSNIAFQFKELFEGMINE